MLRRVTGLICLFLVGLVFNSQTVDALGSNPVIYQLKTGETGFASREYIAIYNNSDLPTDVSGWCIYYASSTDVTKTKLTCLEPPSSDFRLMLEPFGYVRLATTEFQQTISDFTPDFLFDSGLSSSGGHVRVLDKDGIEIDKIGWGTAVNPETLSILAPVSGKILQRKIIPETNYLQDNNHNSNDFEEVILVEIPSNGLYEEEIIVDVCPNITGIQTELPDDYYLQSGECWQDVCDNLEGLQIEIPLGHQSEDGENCLLVPELLESSILQITELLPNVSGVDSGKEFIEIYNPNNKSVNLKGYKLELGPTFTKSHVFEEQIIDPFSFVAFSDLLTKLTLPNSSASLKLIAPNGNEVSESDIYDSPKENSSWALFDNVWRYTTQPTPSAVNVRSNVVILADEELQDCPPGKYRNPETNRCRNIETDEEITPCKQGQERNPETNRCRSISSSDSLVPCKQGQERNPETNRCRNISSTTSALVACDEGQERNPETNRCRKIPGTAEVASANVKDVPSLEKSANSNTIIVLILCAVAFYAIYEWRIEIKKFLSKLLRR